MAFGIKIPSVNKVIGSITGANAAADAAEKGSENAAAASIASTEKNIDFQKWLWGEQKDLTQPFVDAGKADLPAYQAEVAKGMTLDDLYKDPSYQFGMNEGMKAYDNSASAKGMQLSGAAAKGLNRYGQDYAGTKYNEAFNRRQVGLDNLYRMITLGSNASTNQATQGGAMGNQISNSIIGGGQAQAQSYSDIGNVKAAYATSGFNTLMDVGKLAATAYGGSGGGGGGSVGGGGSTSFLDPVGNSASTMNIGF